MELSHINCSKSELDKRILLAAERVNKFLDWSSLFVPSEQKSISIRKLQIMNILIKYSTAPWLRVKLGSILSLRLIELLSLAAHFARNELVAEYIEKQDTVKIRHELAKRLSQPTYRQPIRERPILGEIPLSDWFSPKDRARILVLFSENREHEIIWEYILRIPCTKMREIFRRHKLEWNKSQKLNHHILFAALGNVPYLEWCKLPKINTDHNSELNTLLGLLGQPAFAKNEFILHRTNSSLEECCPVCLSWMTDKVRNKVRQTSCGHLFHKKCILKWLTGNNSCPLCKHNLINSIYNL